MLPVFHAFQSETADFLGWWRDELLDLLPAFTNSAQSSVPKIAIVQDGYGYVVRLESTRNTPPFESSYPQPLDAIIQDALTARATIPAATIVLRLARTAVFRRSLEVPRSATRNLGRILTLDLERATPFRAVDVYMAHRCTELPTGRVRVEHLIAKRSQVDELIGAIKTSGLTIDAVDVRDGDSLLGLGVNLMENTSGRARRVGFVRRLRIGLATLAVLLAGSAATADWHAKSSALSALEPQTQRLRKEAADLTAATDRAEKVRVEREAINRFRASQRQTIEIVNELTRILPDTAYVTDLKVDAEQIEFSGAGKEAAKLPRTLERSSIFTDANLAAPLTVDANDERERFSIRARIRPLSASREVAEEVKR